LVFFSHSSNSWHVNHLIFRPLIHRLVHFLASIAPFDGRRPNSLLLSPDPFGAKLFKIMNASENDGGPLRLLRLTTERRIGPLSVVLHNLDIPLHIRRDKVANILELGWL
jgi:hypothetical protein